MNYAAQLFLGGVAALLAIAPVPFQKWALPRLAFGTLSIACFASAKHKVDIELDLQRDADVWAFNEVQQQKQLLQASNAIAFDGILKSEALRVQFQAEREMAHLQRNRAIVLEAEVPEYLDALEAQQRANLEAQTRSVASAPSDLEAIVSVEGSETVSASVEPQDKGQRLLQRLRKSDMSILVVGSTGAGKSHTLSAYLEFLYQDSPDADVWVISRKNDSFCGLREAGRVVRFNSLDPVDALNKLREVHAIFQERTEVLEEDRAKLSTIRLILEDWSSICLILKKNRLIWNEVQIILSDIVTVGRELNIALFILAQSAILESLGLVGDANLRTCLAIVAQGLESINNKGEKQGDYNLVQLILKNPYIIPSDEDRKFLAGELSDLITESRRTKQPVFLCTGGEAFVGLLPKITKATLPVGRQRNQAIQDNLIVPTKQDDIVSVETQRERLDVVFNKPYNPAEYLLKEMNQQELDALIKQLRGEPDTNNSDVSNTLSRSGESDTSPSEYQIPEPLLRKVPLRIWKEGDFQRYLPKEDENDFFERLIEHQDTSANASDIIKDAWKLTRGEKYSLGRAAFVYLINRYGSDRQKQLYAPFVAKYVADVESDVNKKLIEQTKGLEGENNDSLEM